MRGGSLRQLKHPTKPWACDGRQQGLGRPATKTVVIEGGPPSNYSAWSPVLPGCLATGGTLEEVEWEIAGRDRSPPRGPR